MKAVETTARPAWEAALELFEAGYGDPADLNDATERAAFLALLEKEVRREIEAEIAGYFKAATERMDRTPEELREERR